MDRELNSRLEKDSIYEIYRGCRLCGAGAGYKMPIVQNVVDLEESGVKLSQKIRECVHIEVHQGDKMPPLICELCVDKVNDFYEFLEMCRQTNKQTRLKLGLPLQTSSSGSEFESNNCCILGMSETIYVDDDSDGEPLSKQTNKSRLKERYKESSPRREQRSKSMKDVKLNNKDTPSPGRVTRTSSSNIRQDKMPLQQKHTPAPARVTRTSSSIIQGDRTSSMEEDHIPARVTRTSSHLQQVKNSTPLQETLNKSKTGSKTKSILKKENDTGFIKIEDETSFFQSRKRSISIEKKPAVPSKKVRISSDSPRPSSRAASQKSKSLPQEQTQRAPSRTSSQNSHQRPQKSNQKRSPTPPPEAEASQPSGQSSEVICPICYQVNRTLKGYHSHVKVHVVNYTSNKLACNPCGEWFPNGNESQAHHRLHKYKGLPYRCRRCSAEFQDMDLYENHFTNECIPYDVVPDVKCEVCWRYFATDNLLIEHKCAGEAGRPGGKCNKCNRTYVLMKNLKRHISVCKHKIKNNLIVEPGVMEDLKPAQIRLVRCDPLLTEKNREFLNDWTVSQNYGLDENCVYPFISSVRSLKIKSEPLEDDLDYMVDINDKVKEFLTEEDCIDWDSETGDNDGEKPVCVVSKRQRVDTLAALALKAVVSQRFLGKVPKKYRKIRVDKMFDSLGEFGVKNVDRLLERLEDDVATSDAKEEHSTSDVQNEDSAPDKIVSASDDSNNVNVSVREERRNSEEIKDNDRNSSGSKSDEHCSNGVDESTHKMNLKNEDESENINSSNSRVENSEESVNNVIESSNNVVQDSIESTNSSENNVEDSIRNNWKEDSSLCKDKEYKESCNNIEEKTESIMNEEMAVELNGHKSENNESKAVEESSSNTDSHEVLEHTNGITNKSLTQNNVMNTDVEDKNLMDALDEQIGENKDTDKNGDTLNSADRCKESPKLTFDQNNEFGANIGNEKSDRTANGDIEQKITLEDLFVNKNIDNNSQHLVAISDEEYNFDV